MRKLIMFNLVSVDGMFAGPDGNIDWHVVDDEFNKVAVAMIQEFDTIMFGRVTYDLFENYWPGALAAPETGPDDRTIATFIDDARKIVYTKSRTDPTWKNSEFLTEIDPEFIKTLKTENGKNIVIYGSGTIVQQLTDIGLIDEYRLMVNPIILGSGKPLFATVYDQHKLKHTATKDFASGNVLLTYEKM